MKSTTTFWLSTLVIGVLACNADNLVVGDGHGDDAAAGGQAGAEEMGGSSGAGGTAATGGTQELGGAFGGGGDSPAGGTVDTGGVVSTGGGMAAGGDTSIVDSGTAGGVLAGDASIVVPDTSGESDAAGSEATTGLPLPSGNTVVFSNGMAMGAMTGPGWVALGVVDRVSTPTCSDGVIVTDTATCPTETVWNNPTALCASGTIPALPVLPTAADYANNWGIMIGVSAGEPDQGLGQSFASITLLLSGTPQQGLRAELHRLGDADSTFYCAFVQSGVRIALTSFNTACWDGSGNSLTLADVPNIDKVSVQVSASSTPITLTNLCLSRIVFGQ